MRVFSTDRFDIPLPEGHRFPLAKYAGLREAIVRAGTVAADDVETPAAATRDDLLLAHDADYVDRVLRGDLAAREQREIGLPWSPGLVERSLRSVGATLAACRAALDDGIAVYLGGGTHHAHAARGSGFCVFNDVPVALRRMQREGRIERGAVLDCDVHQGDGTAAILADDASIFTMSVHGARNFPFRKTRSDLDLPLPNDAGDEAFLDAVRRGVTEALTRARPQLAVYLAGADPHEDDRYGRLAVSAAALEERDRFVLDACARDRIPVAVTMAGGYGRDLSRTIEIQARTVAVAAGCYRAMKEAAS